MKAIDLAIDLAEAPPADYLEEVRERRLRLMAQEKARRQARNRRAGEPPAEAAVSQESHKSQPSHSNPMPQEPEEPAYAPQDFAERAAEAAFAARVARVAREHPGSVGQRQAARPPSPPQRIGRNDDFSGMWTDDAGNDYELQQVGSVVTERRQQSCGMAMRNELTMFGGIGTLVDDLIRWSDGSVWARQTGAATAYPSSYPSGARSSSSGADLDALGGFAWKAAARRQRLAPELAELFTPGPDIPSAEWEESKNQSGEEQRLWFAPWVQDGKRGI